MSNKAKMTIEIAVAVLEGAIRNGHIEIRGQTDAEVFEAYRHFIDEFLDDTNAAVELEVSHGDNLLKEASNLVERNSPNLAIVVYATWVEHWLNAMITTALERRDFTRKERKSVLLCNLDSKVGWLWRLLFEEQLSAQTTAKIRQIADARNAFVHYKWPAMEDEENDPTPETLCHSARALVAELESIQDEIYFDGDRGRIRRIIEREMGSSTGG